MHTSLNVTRSPRSFAMLMALSLVLLSQAGLQAQGFMFGPRLGFGFNTSAFEGYNWEFSSPSDLNDLRLTVEQASPETQMGIYGRASLGSLYIQPELLLTTRSVKYLVEDLGSSGDPEVVDERNYQLAIPVMAGLRFGWLRVQGGPVYRMRLAGLSELSDIQGMDRRFASSTLGIQAGLGIDLGRKVALDFRYETNLLQGRDEVSFLGTTHDLSNQSGQLVTSLGVSF